MSSSDPSAHERAGRGVRNFESAAWDREKQHAVLSGKYARSTQNPAMKHHFLSTGNKRLAEASPLDPVWGIGLRADDARAKGPRQWRGKFCSVRRFLQFAKKFATLRPGWQTRPPLVGFLLPRGMLECTKFRPHNSRAHLPRPALAEVLFRSFRPISRTRRPTKARNFWRSLLASALALRCQNTALPRRGYYYARRRFVHRQICNT